MKSRIYPLHCRPAIIPMEGNADRAKGGLGPCPRAATAQVSPFPCFGWVQGKPGYNCGVKKQPDRVPWPVKAVQAGCMAWLWIYSDSCGTIHKKWGWAFARIAYAGRDHNRGVLPRLCALSKWGPRHQCKIRPILYGVAPIWKKEELHTGQVFRL